MTDTKQPKLCFERYEKKYIITPRQQETILAGMALRTVPDEYGRYTVCNIYYDTPDWRLIRASIGKPDYKEKMRVRSYGVPEKDGRVFAEIKKKSLGIVYKRRITTDAESVAEVLACGGAGEVYGQTGREIDWFQHSFKTSPRVFIAYDRIAFAGIEDPDVRITFDTNLRWRDTELDLRLGDFGAPIVPDSDFVLMEIKLPGVCPLWLARLLSQARAYPASFSKYGTCYTEHIAKNNYCKEKRA